MAPDRPSPLSVRDRAIVDFERNWMTRAGAASKAACIRAELDISPTAYYAALERLLDDDAAWGYDPLVITRLRRRRAQRRRARVEPRGANERR